MQSTKTSHTSYKLAIIEYEVLIIKDKMFIIYNNPIPWKKDEFQLK